MKIVALKESISKLTSNYEDRIADLRVEITILQEDNNQLQSIVSQLQNEVNQPSAGNGRVLDEVGVIPQDEVLEGEVVHEED